MIVYEDDTIVGILLKGSNNAKTGNLSPLYILLREQDPLAGARSGADSAICGNCPHRRYHGTLGDCYVNLGQAPIAIWRKYNAGGYPKSTPELLRRYLVGSGLRLGAYGDPTFLPIDLVAKLVRMADFHTGYTHQWLSCDPRWARYVMASVDSREELDEARSLGYRCFRTTHDDPSLRGHRGANETVCPASKERGKVLTCSACRACGGQESKAKADIVIRVHGPWAQKHIKRVDLTVSA